MTAAMAAPREMMMADSEAMSSPLDSDDSMMLVKAKSRRKILNKRSMKKSDGITKKLAAAFVPGGNPSSIAPS